MTSGASTRKYVFGAVALTLLCLGVLALVSEPHSDSVAEQTSIEPAEVLVDCTVIARGQLIDALVTYGHANATDRQLAERKASGQYSALLEVGGTYLLRAEHEALGVVEATVQPLDQKAAEALVLELLPNVTIKAAVTNPRGLRAIYVTGQQFDGDEVFVEPEFVVNGGQVEFTLEKLWPGEYEVACFRSYRSTTATCSAPRNNSTVNVSVDLDLAIEENVEIRGIVFLDHEPLPNANIRFYCFWPDGMQSHGGFLTDHTGSYTTTEAALPPGSVLEFARDGLANVRITLEEFTEHHAIDVHFESQADGMTLRLVAGGMPVEGVDIHLKAVDDAASPRQRLTTNERGQCTLPSGPRAFLGHARVASVSASGEVSDITVPHEFLATDSPHEWSISKSPLTRIRLTPEADSFGTLASLTFIEGMSGMISLESKAPYPLTWDGYSGVGGSVLGTRLGADGCEIGIAAIAPGQELVDVALQLPLLTQLQLIDDFGEPVSGACLSVTRKPTAMFRDTDWQEAITASLLKEVGGGRYELSQYPKLPLNLEEAWLLSSVGAMSGEALQRELAAGKKTITVSVRTCLSGTAKGANRVVLHLEGSPRPVHAAVKDEKFCIPLAPGERVRSVCFHGVGGMKWTMPSFQLGKPVQLDLSQHSPDN